MYDDIVKNCVPMPFDAPQLLEWEFMDNSPSLLMSAKSIGVNM